LEKYCFDAPGSNPVGLVYNAETLLTIDIDDKMVYTFSSKDGSLIDQFSVEVGRPNGVAANNEFVWVLDDEKKEIIRYDAKEKRRISALQVPLPKLLAHATVIGLAYDGKYIWTGVEAGWSSRYYCLDPDNGSEVFSFFCGCDPRGLTSDGEHLWSVCYNGPRLPSRIDRRKVSDEPGEMNKSRNFTHKLDLVVNPTGLAIAGSELFILDNDTLGIYKVEVS
jgi:outer membrane protein assembly factor BamB